MIPARDCFEPLTLNAPGARLRAARFAADPAAEQRGVLVLLNGQTEFIEKYFEVIDELRGRGLTVATLDWRGQGGSERLLKDAPLKAHVADFAQYDRDLDRLMAEVVEPMLESGRRPLALSHSMGGHVLLRALGRAPGRFAGAVFCAPMVQFSTREKPRRLVWLATWAMVAMGRAQAFVWGMAVRDPLRLSFDRQIVTADRARFERTKALLARQPALRLAGPTWGWVAAAWRSQARLSRKGFAEAITTPALFVGAGRDRVVVTAAIRAFARRMPKARYVEIAGAEHEILMERDPIRAVFWQAFDRFLAGLG